MPSAKTRTTRPSRRSASSRALRLVDRHEEEVRARRKRRSPSARSASASRSRSSICGAHVGRLAAARPAQAPPRCRDRHRRLPPIQLGGGLRARRAHSRRARLRGRTPSRRCAGRRRRRRSGLPAVSPAYSKYASSTTSGRAEGSGPSVPVGLFGRQQNVTARCRRRRPRPRRAAQRCGRAGTSGSRRSRPCRPGRRTPARRGGSGRRRPRRGRRSPSRRRRTRRSRRSAPGSRRARTRWSWRARPRSCPDEPSADGAAGDVPVEAHDLDRVDARRCRDLGGGRRPAVLGESCREAPSSPHRRRVRGHPLDRGERLDRRPQRVPGPPRVSRWIVIGFRNVSRPRPPTARAQPPVGSTWFPPVA